MQTLTRAMVTENPEMKEVLMKRIDSLHFSSRCKLHADILEIDFIHQLVEKEEKDFIGRTNFGRMSLVSMREVLGDYRLALSMRLTKELKVALQIPLHGKEPSESNVHLPPIEELDKRIIDLIWLRDNYDTVKAGIKAFECPILRTP